MKNMYLKSEKGITLMSLTVYIIVMLLIVGIVTSVSNYFYGNLSVVRSSVKYAGEFDKINSSLVVDVKANKHVKTNNDEKTIIFEDGTTYKYNAEDEGLYRGQTKIASHITYFTVSSKTIVINNVQKDILSIHVVIGNSSKSLIEKQIDYTLKYW